MRSLRTEKFVKHRCLDPRHAIGVTRREALQVGFSGLAGVGLGQLLAGTARAGSAADITPRAKSVVLIFLTGGASHHDTWDLKPEAPVEIRGSFQPIASPIPGIRFCEHLPRLAQRVGLLALVRSMSHGENSHLPATHRVLTGAV